MRVATVPLATKCMFVSGGDRQTLKSLSAPVVSPVNKDLDFLA